MAKRGTTIRLEEATHSLLEQAAHILGRKKNQIAEEAFGDYFEKHNINSTYELHVTSDRSVLIQMTSPIRIVENVERNGVPAREAQRRYSERLRSHVRLVIQEEEGKGDDH